MHQHQCYDTVGAICIDKKGCLASGVSSGGLILKQEGRVGQASIVGAGCWTKENIAVTTSGVGEYLIRTMMARNVVEKIDKSSTDPDQNTLELLVKAFDEIFFNSCVMRNIPRQDHLAGLIGLILDQELNSIEFFWAHSTRTMCIGYMDSHSSSPISFVSEMQSEPGSTIIAQSKTFRFQ
ncbi:hypothetical protein SSS_07191 [Sarcoptes scabiei]|nr:hypothetical protein SSS_07191 [Sarcoptes scabiei]